MQGPVTAFAMGIALFLVIQLEGNLLKPYILGKAVSLHPLAIPASVTGPALSHVLPAIRRLPHSPSRISVEVVAVSYTHLDVYKRPATAHPQGEISPLRGNRDIPGLRALLTPIELGRHPARKANICGDGGLALGRKG